MAEKPIRLSQEQINKVIREQEDIRKKSAIFPAPTRDRLTVVDTLFHHPTGDQPREIQSRFSTQLSTSGAQPLEARGVATNTWSPLFSSVPHGAKLAQLVVKNLEGRYTQVYPSQEVIDDDNLKVIELGYDGGPGEWLIHPRQSMRGCPTDLTRLYIRCAHKEARYYAVGVLS